MNICLCGAEAGYPHDECCPYPLYRAVEEREQLWREAYERNVNRRQERPAEEDICPARPGADERWAAARG